MLSRCRGFHQVASWIATAVALALVACGDDAASTADASDAAASLDVSVAAPRLRELCDPRVYLYDLTTGTLPTGAAAIAAAVNRVWGTRHDAATIDAALAVGLPPP